jgi:hypothetical protein
VIQVEENKNVSFREPPVNWEQQIENIRQEYEEDLSEVPGINDSTRMMHAVQKDAGQNIWDARDESSKEKVSMLFWLTKFGSCECVVIEDGGTCGLTGRAGLGKEVLDKLDYETYKEERWSRFEALGYRNPDPRALGAKGQGKFVFIASSKVKEILYDTLRKDGVYRVGHWITKRGSKPLIVPLENERGEEYIRSQLPGIKRLDHVGTRIIIKQPIKEVRDAFIPLDDCDLAKYIGETWWELLKEGKCEIYIKLHDEKRKVELPKLYKEFFENPQKFKYWRKTNIKIDQKRFPGCKIKEFVIAYSEEEVPKLLQGIAVQRNKMKVMSFDVTFGNEEIGEEHKKHIFGWVTFNEEAEKVLKEYEKLTHYGFLKPKGSLPQALFGREGVLPKLIRQFAEEELGIVARRAPVGPEDVGREVANFLNRFLSPLKEHPAKKEREWEVTRGPSAPLRLQVGPLQFPRDTRRVNFGETLHGVRARIINNTGYTAELRFEMLLESPRPAEVVGRKEPEVLERIERIEVKPHSQSEWYGPESITFREDVHAPGRYTLKVLIVSLHGKNKGEIVDKVTRAIYVEVEPPATGIFDNFEPVELPETKMYKLEESERGLIVQYNIKHPAYKRVVEVQKIIDKEKVGKVNLLWDYLILIGILVAINQDVRGNAKLLGGEERKNLVRALQKDKEGIHEAVLSAVDSLYQLLLHGVYSSK